MPLLDFSDPTVLAFMAENFVKEKRLRSLWIRKHFGALTTAAAFQKPPVNRQESVASVVKGGIATLARDHRDSYRYRIKIPKSDATFWASTEELMTPHVALQQDISGTADQTLGSKLRSRSNGHSITNIGLEDSQQDSRLAHPKSDLSRDPIMRAVDPKTTEILYKDKPEFGRLHYLAKRSEVEPEKRYFFAECFSWDYGWRLKDANLLGKPKNGRFWTLKRSLSNRVGLSPDPKYYKNPCDITNVSKCF